MNVNSCKAIPDDWLLTVRQRHPKVISLHCSFPVESHSLGWTFGIRSPCRHTPLRLRCDLALHKPRPGTVAFTRGSLPRTTCVPFAASPNMLFPIGVEPEG